MTNYCKRNVVCVDAACSEYHYKDINERRIISGLIKIDELSLFMEDYKPSMPTCRYHLLCFERECQYNHSNVSLDGRKKVIKAFKTYNNKEKARMKIEADIAKFRAGEKTCWADMA